MIDKRYEKVELEKHDFNQLVSLAKAHGVSRSELIREALWWYSAYDELSRKDKELLCELGDQREMSNGDILKRALHFYAAFAKIGDILKVFDDSIE